VLAIESYHGSVIYKNFHGIFEKEYQKLGIKVNDVSCIGNEHLRGREKVYIRRH